MLTRRPMSLPPSEHAPSGLNTSSSRVSDASPLPSMVVTTAASLNATQRQKLAARAESLANLTFELNVRTISHQNERLQRDIAALVRVTESDKEFREKNEGRLQDVFKEMQSLKHHMENVDEDQRGVKVSQEELQRCQAETAVVVEEFRREMGGVKTVLEGLSKQLDAMSSGSANSVESGYASQQPGDPLGDTQMIAAQPANRVNSTESLEEWPRSPATKPEELVIEGHDEVAVADAARRVSEAIQSTKRWHHEHKTTKLPDAQFCVNYLKQQSKRDAKAAVYIQRAIQRRIRRRRGREAVRPKSLEDFCKGVQWEDVVRTVEETLVRDEKLAIIGII
jgi:hypothetical protein